MTRRSPRWSTHQDPGRRRDRRFRRGTPEPRRHRREGAAVAAAEGAVAGRALHARPRRSRPREPREPRVPPRAPDHKRTATLRPPHGGRRRDTGAAAPKTVRPRPLARPAHGRRDRPPPERSSLHRQTPAPPRPSPPMRRVGHRPEPAGAVGAVGGAAARDRRWGRRPVSPRPSRADLPTARPAAGPQTLPRAKWRAPRALRPSADAGAHERRSRRPTSHRPKRRRPDRRAGLQPGLVAPSPKSRESRRSERRPRRD